MPSALSIFRISKELTPRSPARVSSVAFAEEMTIASSVYELPIDVPGAAVIFELPQTWPTLRQVEKEEIAPKSAIVVRGSDSAVELMRVSRRRSLFFANFPIRVTIFEDQLRSSLELSYALRWSDCVAELIVICVFLFSLSFRPNHPWFGVLACLALLQWPWILYRHYHRVCSEVATMLKKWRSSHPSAMPLISPESPIMFTLHMAQYFKSSARALGGRDLAEALIGKKS